MKQSPILKILYYLLQWTWGIIQNVIGLLLWLVLMIKNPKRRIQNFNCAIVTRWHRKGSMCLGMFIFLGRDDQRIIVHEYGHSIQSIILGPFYLIIIGIPSYIWCNLFRKYRKNKGIKYCDFYPEKWANILGVNITGLNTVED